MVKNRTGRLQNIFGFQNMRKFTYKQIFMETILNFYLRIDCNTI